MLRKYWKVFRFQTTLINNVSSRLSKLTNSIFFVFATHRHFLIWWRWLTHNEYSVLCVRISRAARLTRLTCTIMSHLRNNSHTEWESRRWELKKCFLKFIYSESRDNTTEASARNTNSMWAARDDDDDVTWEWPSSTSRSRVNVRLYITYTVDLKLNWQTTRHLSRDVKYPTRIQRAGINLLFFTFFFALLYPASLSLSNSRSCLLFRPPFMPTQPTIDH